MIDLIKGDKFDIIARCTSEKGELLKKLVIENHSQLVVEIGVFKGSSLMYFCDGVLQTGGRIIAIDPYDIEHFKFETGDRSKDLLYFKMLVQEQKTLDEIYLDLEHLIRDNLLSQTIQLVRIKSENYYTNLEYESIDILHIDGNPEFESVTKDILFYLPLVKRGGFIIIGSPKWPGVQRACEEYLTRWVIKVIETGECIVFKRD
jgi:hypothetical protein